MKTDGELPESWRKPAPPAPVKRVDLPECNMTDPAQLFAFYGAFGYGDHLRKILLANCAEIVRAHYALDGERISEARIEQLARVHPNYVEWIVKNLKGRVLYEAEVMKRGIGS